MKLHNSYKKSLLKVCSDVAYNSLYVWNNSHINATHFEGVVNVPLLHNLLYDLTVHRGYGTPHAKLTFPSGWKPMKWRQEIWKPRAICLKAAFKDFAEQIKHTIE